MLLKALHAEMIQHREAAAAEINRLTALAQSSDLSQSQIEAEVLKLLAGRPLESLCNSKSKGVMAARAFLVDLCAPTVESRMARLNP
eukprot:SAG11_NODE_4626_length_1830_cov_1.229925_3_plen_87_part_00